MSSSVTLIAVFIGAYLLSSVPFGLVITRMMGLGDLRKIGSGNIGATNVLRTGSKVAAALTLILDIGKGAIGVVVTMMSVGTPEAMAVAAAAGVIGHCFPIWLGFKGGNRCDYCVKPDCRGRHDRHLAGHGSNFSYIFTSCNGCLFCGSIIHLLFFG